MQALYRRPRGKAITAHKQRRFEASVASLLTALRALLQVADLSALTDSIRQ
jgi:hypothetical protein